MARLVHITGEAEARSIKRSGIRLGRPRRVIYFMPLAVGHHLSYQWARELTRQGVRNHVAVHFQLPDDTMVWHGRYNQGHAHSPLRQAIAEFLRVAEPLGHEFIR